MAEKPETPLPMTVMESVGLAIFLSKDKDSKDPVKNTLRKGMQALAESKKYNEIAKLMRFAEELGEKFLSTLGEQKFKTENPFKILQLLEKERPDWKEIMKRFNKAKSYKVKPHIGDKPAMIVFKYANGKVEEYPLEWTGGQKIEFAEAVTSPLRKKKTNIEEDFGVAEDVVKAIEKEDGEKDIKKGQKESLREGIARSKKIKTPDDAYQVLANSTNYLSDDLLRELSVPFSKIAALWSRINPDAEQALEGIEGVEGAMTYVEDVIKILDKYYPGFSDDKNKSISDEERKDIATIGEKFGVV